MYGLFGSVKPYLIKKAKVDAPTPDNFVFKLHYKVTFSIILVSCILVSTYAYIDKSEAPIQCMMDKGLGIPGPVIDRYCWIMSTFTLPRHFEGKPGKDILHYGVGHHKEDDERTYHAYYQWVPLMLALQAIMFYAPHWIWKTLENGRMKHIVVGLHNAVADDERQNKVDQLAEYMKTRAKMTFEHQVWAGKFFFCECLNFVNVIAQILITDSFLGGEFSKYGTEVLNFPYENPEDRVDPMSRIFPRMTKCIFHKFGGSGTIQRLDALCVLSMNIVNEKIYIFLWFWFIILALITGLHIVWRIAQLFYPNIRDRHVQLQTLGFQDRAQFRHDVDLVVRSVNYSDWLILHYLAQVMEKKNFVALITKMADQLRSEPTVNGKSQRKSETNDEHDGDLLTEELKKKMKAMEDEETEAVDSMSERIQDRVKAMVDDETQDRYIS